MQNDISKFKKIDCRTKIRQIAAESRVWISRPTRTTVAIFDPRLREDKLLHCMFDIYFLIFDLIKEGAGYDQGK